MNTRQASQVWQRVLVVGCALLSVAVPVVALFARQLPQPPLADLADQHSYQPLLGALALGVGCAVVAFTLIRALTPPLLRYLSAGVASLGLLFVLYVLWALVGVCGIQIVLGVCRP